ncbi:hypothetical protein ABIA33_003575 [Streptacidiphilus sp. MAP12-16]
MTDITVGASLLGLATLGAGVLFARRRGAGDSRS